MAGDDSLVVLYDIYKNAIGDGQVAGDSSLVVLYDIRMLLVMARWLVMTHCGAVWYKNAIGGGQC